MLKIRLQRIGKRGQAYFRVVVTEHTRKPKGKYLEDLGSYNPHKNEISVDAGRVKHWIGHGAQTSPTVNNLLVDRGIIEGKKVQVWKAKPSSQDQAEGEKETAKDTATQQTAPVEKTGNSVTEIKEKTSESDASGTVEQPEKKPAEAEEIKPEPVTQPSQEQKTEEEKTTEESQ